MSADAGNDEVDDASTPATDEVEAGATDDSQVAEVFGPETTAGPEELVRRPRRGVDGEPSPAAVVSERLSSLMEEMAQLEDRLARLEEVLSPGGP